VLGVLICGFLFVGCPSQDYDPPHVVIAAPTAGDTMALGSTVTAVVTDQSSILAVDFYAGSRLIGSDSIGQGDTFSISWSTAGFEPGQVETLLCAARDAAENVGRSEPVVVVVGPDAGTHHGGIVSAPETWSAADNPHVVDRDLFVESFLRLAPGVRVLVSPGATVRVGTAAAAGLVAEGTQDSAITMTSLPGAGPWGGLVFRRRAVADSCRLRRCVIERGGATDNSEVRSTKREIRSETSGVRSPHFPLLPSHLPVDGLPLVTAESCAVTITDCRLRQGAAAAIALSGCGFARFSGSTIQGCAGIPVRVEADWAGTVGTDNTFQGNGRNGIEVPGGTVSRSATWPNPGVPWCVTADLAVADTSNPLLVIAEGCSLLFADSAGLSVGDNARPGGLRCDGSVGEIVLGSLTGNWRGVEFRERADTMRSLLRFCTVAGTSRAALTGRAPVSVTGCIFTNSGGIVLRGCGFRQFSGNTVQYCAGYGLELDAAWVGTLGADNTFKDNASPGILVNPGSIERNAEWRNHRAPYVVAGMVEVGGDLEPLLVIDPGTELRFESGAGLAVGRTSPATLRAAGTTDSILFTGADTVPGTWRGVEFHPQALPGSVLDRCRLLYGGGGSTGIVFIDSCAPRITGCEIGWSSNYCIYLRNSELDPDSLVQQNWLHDWDPDFDDIYDAGR
jgi:hypothetical protein